MPTKYPTPQTRPSLVLRLRKSEDVLAWREFLEIYEPVIRSYASHRGLQAADIEDVMQEVLARVAKTIPTWNTNRDRGSFRAWLATVTRNLVIQHFREGRRLPITGQDSSLETCNEDLEFDKESQRQLFMWAARKIQSRFESSTWKAFWLSSVKGLSVEETAGQLQMTNAQIYVARCRVMNRLKETIQSSQFDRLPSAGENACERMRFGTAQATHTRRATEQCAERPDGPPRVVR